MKEKIREFVLKKGWLVLGVMVATFILTLIKPVYAWGPFIGLFIAHIFLYNKWSE